MFTTRAGLVRYVVEATGEDYRGMLHIFDASQLTAIRQDNPNETCAGTAQGKM